MKKFFKVLKWIGVSLMVIVVLLLLINIPDQDLNPEIIALEKSIKSQDKVPDKDNAFYWIVGHTVPKDIDPHKQGILFVQTVNKNILEKRKDIDVDRKYGIGKLEFKGETWKLCKPPYKNCLASYRKHRAKIVKMRADNRILMQRYYRTYRYPYFKDTVTYTIASPVFIVFNSEHRLHLARAGDIANRGQTYQAIKLIYNDTIFWRRILSQSNTGFYKITASHSVLRNLYFVSEIIATKKLDAQSMAFIRKMLVPLGGKDYDFSDAYKGEFLRAKHLLLTDDKNQLVGKYGGGLFFQPQATVNLVYNDFMPFFELAPLPADKFYKRVQALRKNTKRNKNFLSWHVAYNLTGKWITQFSLSSHMMLGKAEIIWLAESKGSVHNLDGLIRLIKLQLTLKQKGIRGKQTNAFIKKSGDRYTNPFTGGPIWWDPQTNEIYFYGIGVTIKAKGKLLSKRIGVRL